MFPNYRPHSWSMLTKIVGLNLVVLFVAFLALIFYVLPLYERDLYQHRKEYLADLVDMAVQVAQSYYQKTLSGELSQADAKVSTIEALAVMSKDNGYYWVHDLRLKMIMHPYIKSLEGHDLADYMDPNGKKLFVEMNKLVAGSGEGYLEYLWPKPGQKQAVAKISYVQLFAPWGWVIGSGMYLDDIAADVFSLRSKVYLTALLLLLFIAAFSILAAARIKKPLQQSLMLLQELPDQYRPTYEPKVLDESGQLLRAMINLVKGLKEAKEVAETASAAKGKFLAQMSHEIRTPMNAITGLTELALDYASSPQQEELLVNIRHSTDHLLSLVNQVLDFSKLEAGTVELEQIAFNLRQTVTTALLPFSMQTRSRGLIFNITLSDGLPIYIIGDPTRLRQVLVNLVGNAVKFTHQGQIDVVIERGAEQQGNQFELKLTVKDTGVGIPQEKIEQIFAPYIQATTATTREYGGTGLGLSIVKQLLKVMQGDITVKSELGVGTSFYVSIPAGIADHDDLVASSDGLQSVAAQRVLLAEDSEINRMVLTKLLERSGHAVDAVSNGREAVEQWKTGRYSLILMDIQMPETDGLAAARIIRELEAEQGGHIPIIAMTGQDAPEDIENCYQSGMDLYLKKPIQCCELISALARVVK